MIVYSPIMVRLVGDSAGVAMAGAGAGANDVDGSGDGAVAYVVSSGGSVRVSVVCCRVPPPSNTGPSSYSLEARRRVAGGYFV